MTPALIVICGSTATGKSGLAMAIAARLKTVILSADSRQVYRAFDIGTAKPSAADQQTIPHYLIDICEPTEMMTLADYQTQAQAAIARCHQSQDQSQGETEDAHPLPLLVGGTGLYIKSVVRGLKIPRVPPSPEMRSQLATLGQAHCYDLLQRVDPESAAKIHTNDAVRTLRALEVFYTTGRPMSDQQGESPPTYPILQMGLDCLGTDDLRQRIERRTRQMVEMGFVQEVERLCQTYGEHLPLLETLGYREMRRYLAGDWSLPEAIAQTVLRTRQFAKRQRTWFRADPTIEWYDATHPQLVDQVWTRIQEFVQSLRSSEGLE